MPKKSAIKTSLFAAEEREQKLDRKGDLLSTLNQHVNFVALVAEIDHIAPRPSDKRGGRPPYPTELMVRVLVLQHLYNLSDEALEYQLLDRLSFQRFCGLRHSSTIPDANTLWVFRERISAAGGADALFDAVQRQLQQHGFIARGGQIVDATLVEAPKQHFHKEEKALLEQAATPAGWTPAQRRQKDTDVNQRAILTTVQRPILTSILWLSDGFLALFEAERIVAGFDDVAMVGDTVEQG